MTRFMRKKLRAFGREEEGLAAVEFAMSFPFIFLLFIFAVELGLIMTKSVMLEHALDMAMRDLRLGRMEDASSDTLKDEICDRLAVIEDCRANIMIELQPIDTNTWAMPDQPISCVDRDEEIQPVVSFTLGQQNEIMLVRACVIVEPLFPATGLGALLPKDAAGGFGMAAYSAFVNEPS
ncbi:MAG: pilus assembly protein [Rhodobacteraceae bacterium]|nr:pilus assembly protein [Paracoccaceae bacterium]MCF8514057.1 pilus assembly protein [Paracoccaceae bacterium]MCF8518301.1 pilus assembly protein [Paracoccaceae bacterium]